MISREPIFSAAFELAWDDAIFNNPKATARTLRHWNDVAPEEMPAMFLAQGNQSTLGTAANGLPTRWQLDASFYLYVRRDGDLSPGEVLNPILDALEAKFDPTAFGPQTLDGLVQWARIEGTVETSEGTLGDLEVCIIPIRIMTA